MTPRPPPDIAAEDLERVLAAQPQPAGMPLGATLGRRPRQHVKRTLLIWLLLVITFLLVWQFLVPAYPVHH